MNQKKNGHPQGFGANRLCGQQTGHPHPRQPSVLQQKTALASQMKKAPAAPSMYRPQSSPKIAQPKMANAAQQNRKPSVDPPVYRPQQPHLAVQPKTKSSQPSGAANLLRHRVAPSVYRPDAAPKVLQTKNSQTTTAPEPHNRATLRGQQIPYRAQAVSIRTPVQAKSKTTALSSPSGAPPQGSRLPLSSAPGNRRSVVQAKWVFKEDGTFVWVDEEPSVTIKVRFFDGLKGLTVESAEQWLRVARIILDGGPKLNLKEYLYDSKIQKTYGFMQQQEFKADLLRYNAQKHYKEQETLLKSVVHMGDWVLEHYLPSQYVYIGLGRSPGGIMAYLQSVCPGNAFSVPLSSFRPGPGDKWSVLHDVMTSDQEERGWCGTRRVKRKPTPGLGHEHQQMLDQHFAEFIPQIAKGKDLLLIDYTQGAQSLIAAQHYLQKYLAAQGSTAKVFALAMHEERHNLVVKGIYDAIVTPRNPVWNPLDRYYNTDLRKQWGERFTRFNLGQNQSLSEAFRRELFDEFSEFGSFKLMEQTSTTFKNSRPLRSSSKSKEITAYDVLRDEVRNVSGLNPSSAKSSSSSSRALSSSSRVPMRIDANVLDQPGRIFGGMVAQIENAINQHEMNHDYNRQEADRRRHEFRRVVDQLIDSSIDEIQRNPQEADSVIRRGIRIMNNLIRRYA
jgi:hypothetical protein